MSQSLTINDREYIPAGEVGRHFGYTRDYILTLTREGKIDGQKIGHRWYVNLDSAEKFFAEAKAERDARRQEVSQIRKAELRTHVELHASPKASAALLETAAIMAIGLLIGATGYLGTNVGQQAASITSHFSFFEQLAVSVYDLISPQPKVVVTALQDTQTHSAPSGSTESESMTVSELPPVHEVVATTTYTSLVIGPGEVFTTTTVQSIRESFSDEVSVSIDPHNPNTGVIIPHFKSGDGEAYRFLMVPVKEDTP